MYKTFFLILRASCRSNVDFPIPGSPPKRVTDPGTKPPPRTVSNSLSPDLNLGIRSTFMSFI